MYTRKLADGRLYYYAKFKDSRGKWGSGIRTGKTGEVAAIRWAQEQIAEGAVPNPRGQIPTLDSWANGFFGVGGRYDIGKQARGHYLSTAYLNGLRQRYKKYVSPVFGDKKIDEISAMDLDEFFLDLYQSELSGSSVNGLLRAVRALFSEAERLDVIHRDPSKKVKRFAKHNRKRGTLSQHELDKLFSIDALNTVWKIVHHLANAGSGTSPIGSSSLRLLKQSIHSKVTYSTGSSFLPGLWLDLEIQLNI